ncbi:cyclin-dependent kinase 4 isoform X2 [Diabrotica undecimpunctata]
MSADEPSYEPLNRIGRGAYGTVYKARDRKTGNLVALKRVCVHLTEDGISLNTLREISLLRQVNSFDHPNIVRLLDVCHGQQMEKELIMYLVFEHVEQDLATYIERHPSGFSSVHIRNLCKEILMGVDFLHSIRVIHRDLKPQNLLVTHDGHIKLADFGLAKIYDCEMQLTSVVVTLWYRAPEVLLGLAYATPVDIWSIGCIMVELYNLKPLFCGTSDGDQLSKIFRVIGKPSEDEWPEESVSIKWESFNVINQIRIDQISPTMCETVCDLITKMLVFDPKKRLTALDALSHKYFTEEPLNT